jgi:hypothetical protein
MNQLLNMYRKRGWATVRGTALSLSVGVLLLAGTAVAQEGHPLAGSWHGTVGEGDDIMDITVIMDWDGTEVTGVINPGFEHAALQNARLMSGDWTVSFEIDYPNRDGQVQRCMVSGAIDQLGSPYGDGDVALRRRDTNS